MTDPFSSRMADLDALAERCRTHPAFETAIVRDASNRSDRDWRWWSLAIERTCDDGSEKRRSTAEVRLNEPASGVLPIFEGRWSARVWRGVSTNSFQARGSCVFPWQVPSEQALVDALTALLAEAEKAMLGGGAIPVTPKSIGGSTVAPG